MMLVPVVPKGGYDNRVLFPRSVFAGRLWIASASCTSSRYRTCFYDSDSAEHLKKCLELACACTFP